MALDLLGKINDERALNVPLRVLRADAEHALGQDDKARDTLGDLLATHPLELGVRQLLIDSLMAAGEFAFRAQCGQGRARRHATVATRCCGPM